MGILNWFWVYLSVSYSSRSVSHIMAFFITFNRLGGPFKQILISVRRFAGRGGGCKKRVGRNRTQFFCSEARVTMQVAGSLKEVLSPSARLTKVRTTFHFRYTVQVSRREQEILSICLLLQCLAFRFPSLDYSILECIG